MSIPTRTICNAISHHTYNNVFHKLVMYSTTKSEFFSVTFFSIYENVILFHFIILTFTTFFILLQNSFIF